MLNKYLQRINELISQYRDEELNQFKGAKGKTADFNDLVWYHHDPNTNRKTRLLACKYYGADPKMRSRLSKDGYVLTKAKALPEPYNHLLKVYIIEVTNSPLSKVEIQSKVISARHVFSLMQGHLYEQNNLKAKAYTGSKGLRHFWNFCFKHKLVPSFEVENIQKRDRSGTNILDKRYEKLPGEHSLIALGTIFSEVFQNVNQDGTVKNGNVIDIQHAVVSFCTCLSLASPNRMVAEITVLPKQKLKSYSEGSNPEVYYLDWIGSKGYNDNRNHILSVLAEQVEKGINFFFNSLEPARIICRYYENPKQSLRKHLGNFTVEPRRKKILKMNKSPNLFQLGYALGFYDYDQKVYILKQGAINKGKYSNTNFESYEHKAIYLLKNNDKVSGSIGSRQESLNILFGQSIRKNKNNSNNFDCASDYTISYIEEWWVNYFTTELIPEFPYSYTSSENKVRLSNALLCIPGKKNNTKSNRGRMFLDRSLYAIHTANFTSSLVTRKLTGSVKNGTTIFEDFGFSNQLALKPNSLRHYANTLADLSDIPIEITTAWSGRVNPEQTHTYIHTSEDEKADRVRAIINTSCDSTQSIKVISAKEISRATNLPATISSTGICTQELNVMPCDYLNDFISQCFMCGQACHIAGDEESINFLEKDLLIQNKRLEAVKNNPRLASSKAMQDWYVLHTKNIAILSMLVTFMKEQPKGTIIRYANNDIEFNLTDLSTKKITSIKISLPEPEKEIYRLINNPNGDIQTENKSELLSLLSSFGLEEENF